MWKEERASFPAPEESGVLGTAGWGVIILGPACCHISNSFSVFVVSKPYIWEMHNYIL